MCFDVQTIYIVTTIQKVQSFIKIYNCRAVTFYVIGAAVVNTLGVCYGLLIYAKYESVDLLENKIISSDDQLVPYFVMEVTQNIPGLSGLFVAAIFGCALRYLHNFLRAHKYSYFKFILVHCLLL